MQDSAQKFKGFEVPLSLCSTSLAFKNTALIHSAINLTDPPAHSQSEGDTRILMAVLLASMNKASNHRGLS